MAEGLCSIRIPNYNVADGTDQKAVNSLKSAGYFEIVDQLSLPHTVNFLQVKDPEDAARAIKTMQIRGAPAIASCAALSLITLLTPAYESDQQVEPDLTKFFSSIIKPKLELLVASRPTAVNLSNAINKIEQECSGYISTNNNTGTRSNFINVLSDCAIKVWSQDLARNRLMGDFGREWLLSQFEEHDKKINVLTVCNTGSLATSGYGTAFGLITNLHQNGKLGKVYFAQTAPYNQGARLTALEFKYLGIDAIMVPDTAMASLLGSERIDAFIAGADRIALNGDSANKVSTYQISLLCHNVPTRPGASRPKVIVSAPWDTVDTKMETGQNIVIEQRPEIEACMVKGLVVNGDNNNGQQETVLFTPKDTRVYNPAFDITPGSLIDAVVTDKGVFSRPSPDQVLSLKQ